MIVKLIFNAQFCGRIEKIVELPNNISDEEIMLSFEKYMGFPYNHNCSFCEVKV